MTVEDRLWETANELQGRVAVVRRPSIPGRLTPRRFAWKTLAAAGGVAVLLLVVWLVSVVKDPAPVADQVPQVSNVQNEFVPPFGVPSRIVEDEVGPLEWVWKAEFASVQGENPNRPFEGPGCYGASDPPRDSSQTLVFNGERFFFTIGLEWAPAVSLTESDGSRAELGNPFGPDEWVCHVSHNEDALLAVGSRVWWSVDGRTWNVIDAFDAFGGENGDRRKLIWSGSGPLGYVVLGRARDHNWYSPDLVSWFRIDPADEARTPVSGFGWTGPSGVLVSDEFVAVGLDEGVWVGMPRAELAPAVHFPSKIVEGEEGPLDWVWKDEFESVELDRPTGPDDYYYNPSRTDLIEPAQGCDVAPALGWMGSNVSSQTVVFNGDRFFFTVGLDSVPEVWLSGGDGTRTNLGNPFGPDEWVCHVSNTEEVFLAVGSGVWWSADGLAWNVIDAFDAIGGPYVHGSTLILSGSGPLGHVVLSQDRLNNWYSVDLVSWFRITPTERSTSSVLEAALERPFGLFGVASIFMSEDFVAVGADEGVWVGMPRVEEK